MTRAAETDAAVPEATATGPGRARPAARRGRRPGRNARLHRYYVGYVAPAGVFLVLFCIYPFFDLVRMSLSSVSGANLLRRTWDFVGTDNFAAMVADPAFGRALVQTVLLMVVVVSVTTVGGVVTAFVLQRETRANQGIQAVVVFLWALPPLVTASVWKFLLSSDGLVPAALVALGLADRPPAILVDPDWALLAVAVAISWTGVAFASLVMRAGLLGLDQHQIEAASIDGATRAQLVRHIFLPALRPSILVQGLLAMLYAFRVFDYPFIMTAGGPGAATTTLPYLAYKQSFGSLNFGVGAATATSSVLLVVAFSLVYLWLIREEEAA